MLDAAEKLFTRNGYNATSVQAIADEAQVALRTLYLAYGNKRSLLMALWNHRIRGDSEPIPVADRPWFREVINEPDPRRQLELIARNSRQVKDRAGALMEVIRSAAPAEREIGGLWQRLQDEFHANQRLLVEQLAHSGGLKNGLSIERATDILSTLNSSEVHQLLVGRRRWSPEEYEAWLVEVLSSQLL
ncbi:MAG: TetR/AcrR family transcriptional regulator [Solirubrobacteraceae bacterium]